MGQSILLVDDEVHMLRLLERILGETAGHDVVATPNSLEVPRILEGRRFDLVIADLKMPGMDGLDLVRWMRERGREEEVIIITAFGSLESTVEALSLGVFDYITKPFKKDEILYSVERAMRWQRARRAARTLERLLGTEPYAAAEAAFRRLYVARAVERCGGDLDAAARRAGLPAEEVARLATGAAPTQGEEA